MSAPDIIVAALAAVGFCALVMGAIDAIRGALRPRRDWEFGNPAPCERVERPTPTPRPPRARPAGPFGTQTFPIYPRPGDPDYRTKVEPTAAWPPPPPPRRDSGVAVKGTIKVESAPGVPMCQCVCPSRGPAVRGPGFLLDSCTWCGLPIPLSRSMPDAALVDGQAYPFLLGWIMPSRGQGCDPRPVWGPR